MLLNVHLKTVKMVNFMLCEFCHNLEKCLDVGSSYLQTHRLPGFIVCGAAQYALPTCRGDALASLTATCVQPTRQPVSWSGLLPAQKENAFPGVYKGPIGPPPCASGLCLPRGVPSPKPLCPCGVRTARVCVLPNWAGSCPEQGAYSLSPYFQVVLQHRTHS